MMRTRPKGDFTTWYRNCAGLLALFALLPLLSGSRFEEPVIPADPLRGRLIFEKKGCTSCHAIQGEGGTIGPDLGHRKFYGSFPQLAGIMWNHAPEMLRRMRELDLPYPEFSRSEIRELIAYLYTLRYLGEPGDLYRGKVLLEEKKCLACHSLGGHGGKSAPPFDQVASYVSPLYLAQELWNHGPAMEAGLRARGLTRPTFKEGEIVDLSAYIRAATRGSELKPVYLSPGNPQRGPLVMKKKGCLDCHSLKGQGGDLAGDFADEDWNYSVTEIAGLMWNHGSTMSELMLEKQIDWPKFQGGEMADLISFLYFLGFEGAPGDSEAGARLFQESGCAHCHGTAGRGGQLGPDLSAARGLSSTTDLARIMWNHAPAMDELTTERAIEWPRFEGKEMADLYAYLLKISRQEDAAKTPSQ